MRSLFKKIFNSFRYALNGLKAHSRHHNFIIMLISAFLVGVLGLAFRISSLEWLILVIIISAVLALETLNTALEQTLDYLEPNFSDKIRIIKDLLAGTVAISIFASVAVFLILFGPKIALWLQSH